MTEEEKQLPPGTLVARRDDDVLHVTWATPAGKIGRASMPATVEGCYCTLSVPVSLTFRFEDEG